MRNNQTVKKAKTRCCPMCSSTEFSAHQVIHKEQMAADEDVMSISKRLISKNRQAYEVLAK